MDVREKLTHILTSEPEMLKNLNVSSIRLYRLVDKLIANGVTILDCKIDCANCWKTKMVTPMWISVKDRLPENDQDVLVANNGFIAVWTFYGDYWEDSHGWWQEFDEVTHWMPLPQPPKGE